MTEIICNIGKSKIPQHWVFFNILFECVWIETIYTWYI